MFFSLVKYRLPSILIVCLITVSLGGCAVVHHKRLREATKRADQQFEQGRFNQAVLSYRKAIELASPGVERERMIMQIGACFYNERVQNIHDAQSLYRDYLEQYEDGFFVKEATNSLERLNAVLANRRMSQVGQTQQALQNEAALRKALEQRPYDAQLYFQLGNVLWELERYEEATEYYLRSLEINAWLEQHELIRNRLTTDAGGNVVPLTPELQEEREIADEPLVVSDLNEYRSRQRKGEGTAAEIYYNVQGLVRNRSPNRLYGVVIEVRFYNNAREILDVQRDFLGSMPAGAIRGFRVRAENFDNILNIAGYECIPYHEK